MHEDINLKIIKLIIKELWEKSLPIRKRKQPSYTPMPPGAAGIIKPIDQDRENIVKIKR